MTYLFLGERWKPDDRKVVFRDGLPFSPMASRTWVNLAPTFSWGCLDTLERAQLAVAILLDVGGGEVAKALYTEFAQDVLGKLREWPLNEDDCTCWWMTPSTVEEWLEEHRLHKRDRKYRRGRPQ